MGAERTQGASADADRAVVNGAASVPAVPASIPSAMATCPECAGEGWVIGIGVDCEDRCCGMSDWECGGRGCVGPRQEQVQIQIQEGCENCFGTGAIPAQAIEARRAGTGTGPVADESAVANGDAPQSAPGIQPPKTQDEGE